MYPGYPYQPLSNPFAMQLGVSQSQPLQIQYVNGKESAETFQMPANSSVILMDQNKSRFYMKKTDASGQAIIKSYDFKESEEEKPKEYVTKQEFEAFKNKLKGERHESYTGDAPRRQ